MMMGELATYSLFPAITLWQSSLIQDQLNQTMM
jgi:hypothetical protein